MTDATIYIVDDEPDIVQLVANELERYGHSVTGFSTAAAFTKALQKHRPKLCIIDLSLPDQDGLNLVRELTEQTDIGVIILSGRDSLPDRVLGLELGADDYIAKPFDPRELVARAHSLIRRMEKLRQAVDGKCAEQGQAHFGGWVYDPCTLSLSNDTQSLELSAGEAELLNALLKSPKKILNRDQLLADRDEAYDRSIDVRMSRIRKKIEADPKQPKLIKTVYGLGYMLTCEVEWR